MQTAFYSASGCKTEAAENENSQNILYGDHKLSEYYYALFQFQYSESFK